MNSGRRNRSVDRMQNETKSHTAVVCGTPTTNPPFHPPNLTRILSVSITFYPIPLNLFICYRFAAANDEKNIVFIHIIEFCVSNSFN